MNNLIKLFLYVSAAIAAMTIVGCSDDAEPLPTDDNKVAVTAGMEEYHNGDPANQLEIAGTKIKLYAYFPKNPERVSATAYRNGDNLDLHIKLELDMESPDVTKTKGAEGYRRLVFFFPELKPEEFEDPSFYPGSVPPDSVAGKGVLNIYLSMPQIEGCENVFVARVSTIFMSLRAYEWYFDLVKSYFTMPHIPWAPYNKTQNNEPQ